MQSSQYYAPDGTLITLFEDGLAIDQAGAPVPGFHVHDASGAARFVPLDAERHGNGTVADWSYLKAFEEAETPEARRELVRRTCPTVSDLFEADGPLGDFMHLPDLVKLLDTARQQRKDGTP
jgi:hypothetical protein